MSVSVSTPAASSAVAAPAATASQDPLASLTGNFQAFLGMLMTQLQNQGNFQLTHVPYKGGGPALQDAVGGQVPLIAGTVFLISPQVDGKNLVPLAVTSAKRIAKYPDVKTIAEQGFPGYESVAWWGVFAPAKTPPAVVNAMNAALVKVLSEPAVRDRLIAQGMEIVASKPDELGKFLDVEIDRWAKVIKENKIKAGE